MVEQLAVNQWVVGSSPTSRAKFKTRSLDLVFCFIFQLELLSNQKISLSINSCSLKPLLKK